MCLADNEPRVVLKWVANLLATFTQLQDGLGEPTSCHIGDLCSYVAWEYSYQGEVVVISLGHSNQSVKDRFTVDTVYDWDVRMQAHNNCVSPNAHQVFADIEASTVSFVTPRK